MVVVMLTQRSVVVLLVGGLLLGCNRTDPTPAPPVAVTPPGKVPDLKQLAVWFMISGVRDNNHENELQKKIVALKDDEEGRISQGGGNYGPADRCHSISPIKDLEAAAVKVDFGLVLAVDPVDRVILVDASAKSMPRPEKGWPGTKVIDEYILRAVAKRCKDWDIDLVEKLGPEKVVAVVMPGDGRTGDNDMGGLNGSIIKKLNTLAPVKTRHNPGFYGPRGSQGLDYFVLCVVAPIEKFSDVVKVLDGVPDVAVDEERRVVIVGFSALKPGWTEVKEQKPAPSK